jgi:anti-sigma factor RsiW
MIANSSHSDLPLHAFRYAAGELSAAETAEFEQLLATDPDAQRALVHAVQLAAVLQSAAPTIAPVARTARRVQPTHRWSPVLALLGSAAVAATVLVVLRDESTPMLASNSVGEHSGADATVSLWNELHSDDVESASLDEAALLALEDEQTESDVIPDWMLAAVEIGDAPPGSDAGDSQSADDTDPIDDES